MGMNTTFHIKIPKVLQAQHPSLDMGQERHIIVIKGRKGRSRQTGRREGGSAGGGFHFHCSLLNSHNADSKTRGDITIK